MTDHGSGGVRAEIRGGSPRRLPPALVAAGLGAVALGFLLLVGAIVGGAPFGWDRAVLLALRTPGDPARPIGPGWLLDFMRDVTALGDRNILTLAVVAAAGLLLVRRLWLTALLVIGASVTGSWATAWAKAHVARARPDAVPHLVEVHNLSFPSGHATNSAIIYLTLAALATQVTRDRAARNYIVVAAVLLVGLIGVSRLYLGVHWPSDVLAGWSFGTLWALGWWLLGAKARAAVGGERSGSD